jgi:hypothetical protein
MSEQMGRQSMPQPCSQWAKRLAAHLPGDLTPDEQQALRRHVTTCPACAAVLAEYEAMDAGILALPAVESLSFARVESIISTPIPATMNSQGILPITHERERSHLVMPARLKPAARFASLAAAILFVGAIASSLLLVMALHRPQAGNNGGQQPAPVATAKAITKEAIVCPPDGTARAAYMPPLTSTHNHDNLIYVDNEQATSSPKSAEAIVMRYDAVTGQKTAIIKLVATTIINAEVSPDGQWALLVSQSDVSQYELQIVRVDGKYLQTLACSLKEFMYVSWSPSQQWALISEVTSRQAAISVLQFDLLQLATGSLRTLDFGAVTSASGPVFLAWLDDTHFAVAHATDINGSGSYTTTISSFDITQTVKQSPGGGQYLAGPLAGAVNFASNEDGAPLYISQCSGSPQDVTPPCSISEQDIHGGAPQVIYKSTNLAITAIRAYGKSGLLVMIHNILGNTSQNGVYKLNNTTLTRLFPTSESAPTSFNPFTEDPWANVSRDGNWYALKIEVGASDTLAIGSMNGGPLTTIDTRGQDNWSISGAVGWATM